MTINELAVFFQKLEQTSSRLAMTALLARLFRKAGKGEIEKICYLLQGRVAPLYEAVEFGIADKLMIRAIAQSCGIEAGIVTKEFKNSGDLGSAAEKLKSTNLQSYKATNTNKLRIKEVYEQLSKLARASGEGSQEQKISLLANLLKSVDALSARYIVRIPLDKLRLGFSDMTILDALSWMEAGNKSFRPRLEAAYNVRPDIGYLASTVKSDGIKGLAHVHAKVGAPILASLCARLPNADEMVEKMREVAVEPKYDGVRCIGGRTSLFTKNRGYIVARNIRVGDEVLTHKGRFKKITAVHKRLRRKGEQIFSLQTLLGDRIILSESHKILVARDGKHQWLPVREVSMKDKVIFPRIQNQTPSISSNLTLVDGAGYKKIIPQDDDFFRLLGFWIGDGFSNNSHQSERIGLSFNAGKELKLADEYEKIIRNILGIQEISRYTHNGALNLYWRDAPFRKWITSEFRYELANGDHGKQIPFWMQGVTKNHFFAFIRGWQEADGTERHSGGNRITTKEHRLASMLIFLAYSFDYPAGVRKIQAAAVKNGIKRTYYELIFPGTTRYVTKMSNTYHVKLNTVHKIYLHPKTTLYDFQVENDESFCVSLISLHNCQIHMSPRGVNTFSRNLENTTAMFTELKEIDRELAADEVILDSEAVGYDAKSGKLIPFQETVTRKRKHGVAQASKSIPLKFFVFDILYKNGKELLSLPLSARRKILEETLRKNNHLMLSPQIVTRDVNEIRRYHDEQLKKGLEGVVVKKWDSIYTPGRAGYHWVKFKEEEGKTGKLTDTIDAVIMGYYKGEGKRAGFGIGAFLVGIKKGDRFVTITKIGTGVTDALWKKLRQKLRALMVSKKPKEYEDVGKIFIPDVWVAPGLVVEIAGDDLTKSATHGAGIAVRFPRLVRVRSDKSPKDATTVAEARRMYNAQANPHSRM